MLRKERNELKKLAEMQEAAAGISNIKKFFNTSRTESSTGRLLHTVLDGWKSKRSCFPVNGRGNFKD
jgi:hypothetical protein